MQKLLKKSSSTTSKKLGATSFIHARGDNVSPQMWHDACDATVKKYNTVVPQHNALQPASPAFLKNFDEIDWGHGKEEKKKELTCQT